MKESLTGKLGKPKPGRFYEEQEWALKDIARRNRKESFCKLQRIGADLLIRVTDLNGGLIPALEQIRLQRALVRRANRDARRSR